MMEALYSSLQVYPKYHVLLKRGHNAKGLTWVYDVFQSLTY